MSIDTKTALDRINFKGNLRHLVSRICTAFQIDKPTDFSVSEVGYEDCNIFINTRKDKYVAKIFSKARTDEDIARYCTIMNNIIYTGVSHPQLITTVNGMLYVDKEANNVSIVLMRCTGKSFYELKQVPNTVELRLILQQASIINSVDYQPPYIFDSWAIPNIHMMFDKINKYVETIDFKLLKHALDTFDSIPVNELVYSFVHGDLTKGNVLKDESGKIFIIDFSVANWYPRIQELAVIIANLLYSEQDKSTLQDRCELVAHEYSRFIPLTPTERKYLYSYSLSGIAMEFMGAHQEKFVNGNDTEETEFWFKLGRDSLQKALNNT